MNQTKDEKKRMRGVKLMATGMVWLMTLLIVCVLYGVLEESEELSEMTWLFPVYAVAIIVSAVMTVLIAKGYLGKERKPRISAKRKNQLQICVVSSLALVVLAGFVDVVAHMLLGTPSYIFVFGAGLNSPWAIAFVFYVFYVLLAFVFYVLLFMPPLWPRSEEA